MSGVGAAPPDGPVPGATAATATAAEPVAGGGPSDIAPVPPAPASPAAPAAADTTAAQSAPGNVNVNIRIDSPGNDGPVTQTTVAGAGAVPVAATTTAPAGVTDPAQVASGATAPTTWIWNWTWEAAPAGCAPGAAPSLSSSVVSGATWTWTWVWRCAPAPPRLPGFDATFPLGPDPVPHWGAPDRADATAGSSTRSAARPAAASPSHPRATRGRSEGIQRRWATLDVSPTGHGGADAGARPASAAARAGGTIHDGLIPSGMVASFAAGAGGSGAGSGGIGFGAAALLAAFVLFAPHLLLPLRAAAARRLPHVSARRERPG